MTKKNSKNVYSTRREFFKKSAITTLKVIACGSSGFLVKIWDEYISSKKPEIPTFNEMFTEWKTFELVPGRIHPKYGFNQQIHPDIIEAESEIANLIIPTNVDYEYVKWSLLPKPLYENNLFLIGGPLSNDLSRNWRGFSVNSTKDKTGQLYLPNGMQNEMRWEFLYSEYDGFSSKPVRYVDNKEYESEPKFLLDSHNNSTLNQINAKLEPGTNKILSDFLLITYIPNILPGGSKSFSILDIADLHGLGDQAFALIAKDEGLRTQFYEATFKKGIRKFQVLYEVPVYHDNILKKSFPKKPRIIDVHKIT